MPEPLADAVIAEAQRRGMTLAALVRIALENETGLAVSRSTDRPRHLERASEQQDQLIA
ncbi:MAG: hypothetical protein WCF04_15005 [Candidatus Nanopelagicales bacterium]